MTFKRLDGYKGKLSAQQIADGMNAAARNARRLHTDAVLLLENGRFPTAASIAILAIEEAGKISVLRNMSTAPDDETVKAAWRDYRTHTAKNVQWIIGELAAKGAKTLWDLFPMYDPSSDHPAILDANKQLGFYTDCLGKARWSEPIEVIDEQLARSLVFIAQVTAPKKEVSVREVELWITHIGPYRGTPAMAHGLLQFFDAMREEGLGTHEPEEVRRFLGLE